MKKKSDILTQNNLFDSDGEMDFGTQNNNNNSNNDCNYLDSLLNSIKKGKKKKKKRKKKVSIDKFDYNFNSQTNNNQIQSFKS